MTITATEHKALLIIRDHIVVVDGVPTLPIEAAYLAVRRIVRLARQEQSAPLERMSRLATPWKDLGLTPPASDPSASIADALVAAGILDWATEPAAEPAAEPTPFEPGWLGPVTETN